MAFTDEFDLELIRDLPPAQRAEVMEAYLRETEATKQRKLDRALDGNEKMVRFISCFAITAVVVLLINIGACETRETEREVASAEKLAALKATQEQIAMEKGYIKAGDYVRCAAPEGALRVTDVEVER
jgi:anti-sigma-K factor RskA